MNTITIKAHMTGVVLADSALPLEKVITCPACHGMGNIERSMGQCSVCDGVGKVKARIER